MPIDGGTAAPPEPQQTAPTGPLAAALPPDAVDGGSTAGASNPRAVAGGAAPIARASPEFSTAPSFTTSWPYPVLLEPDGVSGSALASDGGRMLGAQSFGDNVSGGAQILSGGALRQTVKGASAGVDSVSGSAQVLSGGALRQTVKGASAGVDSVSGSASIRTGGVIKTTVIPYDISAHDTDRITGVAQILSGGTLL